jgi:hypothetical protein
LHQIPFASDPSSQSSGLGRIADRSLSPVVINYVAPREWPIDAEMQFYLIAPPLFLRRDDLTVSRQRWGANNTDSGFFHVCATPSLCVDQLAAIDRAGTSSITRLTLEELTVGAYLTGLVFRKFRLVYTSGIRFVTESLCSGIAFGEHGRVRA